MAGCVAFHAVEAEAAGARVILTAPRQGDAQRPYERRGFVVAGRDGLDVYMERPPAG